MAAPDPSASPRNAHGIGQAYERRHVRENVEMLARFRRDVIRSTVMLKDLTRFGARVEGVGQLRADEAVSLALPGCRPAMAFVAWSNDHGTGLEFAEPLDNTIFAELVAQYGLGRAPVA